MWTSSPVLWSGDWHHTGSWGAYSVIRAWGCFPKEGVPTRHTCATEAQVLVWLSASAYFHENPAWLQSQRRCEVPFEPGVNMGSPALQVHGASNPAATCGTHPTRFTLRSPLAPHHPLLISACPFISGPWRLPTYVQAWLLFFKMH